MRRTLPLLILLLAGCSGPVDDDPPDEPGPAPVAEPGFGAPVTIAEATGRELSLAVDPSDPARMIACAPTGTSVVGFGHSDVWLTLDGGASWAVLDPESGTDTRSVTDEGGDCDVAIGPDGMLYLADTWLGDLSVAHSRDGQEWTGRAVTVTAPVVDRPWLAVDDEGVLHLTYQDVQALMPSVIWYTRSSDHGETFSPSVPVARGEEDGAFTWTGNLVAGETLHSIYTRREAPTTTSLENGGPEEVWVASSTDGMEWTSTLISARDGPSSFLYPAIAQDGEGVLYATFSEHRGADQPTFWTRSEDGVEWSEPQPFLEGVRSGAPWVTAGPRGAGFQFLATPDLDRPPAEQRWWFYWGRVADDVSAGRTTKEPVYVGGMQNFPEFNMIRADAEGRLHLAGVAPAQEGQRTAWRPLYQGQAGGALLV